MRVLVTGGAGFIGRWVVKKLVEEGHEVYALDNLSNGRLRNVEEFRNNDKFHFKKGDITDFNFIKNIFEKEFQLCVHAAAQINVQESLDNPEKSFLYNVVGTYNILKGALKNNTKVVLIGTCMVYDVASADRGIDEKHTLKPTSPYAGTKLAAEELALSYYHGFGLPVVITRPFNTYGPFQKTNMEGSVVSIFIERELNKRTLKIFGDGTQTRDLLYVEDCADFIYKASMSEKAVGKVINAGLGKDITINDLARMICKDENRIKHVKHHHPQSEIQKLLCNPAFAKKILGWESKTSLEEGIRKTKECIKNEQ